MNLITDIAISLLTILVAAIAVLIVWVGAKGVLFAVRAARAAQRGTSLFPGAPNPTPSLGLAAAVSLDELLVSPMALLSSMAPAREYEKSSVELDQAVRFYEANGWLDDPGRYFLMPSAPTHVEVRTVDRRRGPLEVIRFASEWAPHPGEPGGERWHSFSANRDVFATALRHEGAPRPWIVCLHGQGMGRVADVDFLRMRRVHRELGVNVLLPVLPLHGPRREGLDLGSEQQFVSNVYPVNNVLGLANSMWDLRRTLAWLREHEGATSIALHGFSLGSYAASLLSTLDGDLACVIAVVPSGDLAEALRTSEPMLPSKRRYHRMVNDTRSALVHRVVSPLVKPCLVPKERRFIVAGLGDRIAPVEGALLLWRHWEQPAIWWRPLGHVTTAASAEYDHRLASFLRTNGVATA